MFDIGIVSAFLAGVLMFLAPCTLPLVPGYLAFLGGVAHDQDPRAHRWIVFSNAFAFTLGFTLLFVALGLASGAIGAALIAHRVILSRIGGAFVVLFGLSMIGFFSFPALGINKVRLPKFITAGSRRGSFFMGLLFALGWSPCLGPILGSILVIASTSGHTLYGAYLLFVFAFGLAFPFLMLAAMLSSAIERIAKIERFLPAIAKAGGAFFVLIGLLLLFGKFGVLSAYLPGALDITRSDWIAERM